MLSSLEFNYLTQLLNFINLCYKYGLKFNLPWLSSSIFFSENQIQLEHNLNAPHPH